MVFSAHIPWGKEGIAAVLNPSRQNKHTYIVVFFVANPPGYEGLAAILNLCEKHRKEKNDKSNVEPGANHAGQQKAVL